MLSQLFNTSLDILVKGDVIEMEKQVEQDDVRRFKRDTVIFTVLIILTVVSAVPLFLYLELSGIVLWLLIAGVMIYYAMRLNKQKRNNDIQTYREILAFMEDKENEQ
jgi:flagellar basal body-associated protein FliL